MTYAVPQSFKALALRVSQQNMAVFGVTSEEKKNAFGEHVMQRKGNRDKAGLDQVKEICSTILIDKISYELC